MDAEYEAIVKAIDEYQPTEKDTCFVGIFVIDSVTEKNVHEVMKLMTKATEKSKSRWKFW